jgi:nucleoid DNA-binding protein
MTIYLPPRPKKVKPPCTPLRELIHDTAVNCAKPKALVNLVVDHFISVIAVELAKGREIDVHNFGRLRLVNLKAGRAIRFKMRARLRDFINKPLENIEK